ncbi:hypothetical protein [Pseudomonas syringae]|uniref:hypothetical protein n=1 Tax=Pseudomonas syringae TaxID=317 RepID=UPI001F1C99B2|nr:hypothetical protein [Pseudomonas syringae]
MKNAEAAGLLLSFAGVAFISGGPSIPNVTYLIILLVSAAGWGWSNILVKTGPKIHPVTMLGWSSFFSIPQVALAPGVRIVVASPVFPKKA